MMSMLGVVRLHVAKVLNHAEDSVTAVYDRHDYFLEKGLALSKWEQHLREVVSGVHRKVVPIGAREAA